MPHEATTVCAHDPIAESGTARAFPRAAELKRSGSGVICARFTASGNERARRVITHGLQVRYRAHTVGTSSCTTSPAAASHLAARRMGAPGRYSRDRRTPRGQQHPADQARRAETGCRRAARSARRSAAPASSPPAEHKSSTPCSADVAEIDGADHARCRLQLRSRCAAWTRTSSRAARS